MKSQIAKIVKVESYSATLKQHPKNKTLKYKLTTPLAYNGFHNAKTRLAKTGCEFVFDVVKENGVSYLEVKRIK